MKKYILNGLLALVLIFTSLLTFAQKLSDFKRCSAAKYADAIPYTSLKSKVKTQTSYVTNGKKGTKGLSPSILGPQQKNILKKLKELNEEMDEAEEAQKKWEEDNPGTNNPYDRDVVDADKAVEEQEKKVREIYAKLDDGIKAYETLVAARVKMRGIFKNILDELDDSEERPDAHLPSGYSEADEKELIAYIEKIRKHIKQQAEVHLKEEKGAEGIIKELKELIKAKI